MLPSKQNVEMTGLRYEPVLRRSREELAIAFRSQDPQVVYDSLRRGALETDWGIGG